MWMYNYLRESTLYNGTESGTNNYGYWISSSLVSDTISVWNVYDRINLSANTTSETHLGARLVIVIQK